MIPVFRKYFLHKVALNVVLCVVETLLGPQPLSCGLSFSFENLGVEESDFVEGTIKALLEEFSKYVAVVRDGSEISINLKIVPALHPNKILTPGTSE